MLRRHVEIYGIPQVQHVAAQLIPFTYVPGTLATPRCLGTVINPRKAGVQGTIGTWQFLAKERLQSRNHQLTGKRLQFRITAPTTHANHFQQYEHRLSQKIFFFTSPGR
ncbi:hypothetical protein NCU17250 [Neurospora crassa OR74A]|uniref:Uncharacterized protein n=1 Tax=Neurospora crassa (strain ATCC 24698 / 74-OR23-1A / CBS 708.71 / DSM 1257 / FGSC 987) TaxID=367110 RepID=V5IL31_NEUCR|nr:hypothetical protein NCU17250 [Neurospora crassa OR74A]ESA42005.1 hypothetical protein NCU17250 [Neurospora crassa OR74A]|eukprot:XP_011395377.1 hypothetical protein NCU17250 [Neurospora crassa OR74A]